MTLKNDSGTSVGIIIPTMNRSGFMIRQLKYHASLGSPHTIYIADSSRPEEAEKIKKAVARLKNKLNIVYNPYPPRNIVQCLIFLLSQVKEKYVSSFGDDDFFVPKALSECADFLEKNPDYETAIGRAVTIRVKENRAYGELVSIHDYKRDSIESDKATERLFEFLGPKISALIPAVVKTDHLLKYYQDSLEICDDSIRGEMLPSCLMIIAGKSKVIDRLGLVRQIHNSHFKLADIYDWITGSEWCRSYSIFRDKTTSALMAKDGVNRETAEQAFKKSMWFHLQKYLPKYYNDYVNLTQPPVPKTKKRNIKTRIGNAFPFVKRTYRKYLWPLLNKDELQLHYEITRPDSKYYQDFQSILMSLKNDVI